MKMFRKDEGFTLVELMVVVLIIGILVAVAIPVFNAASGQARERTCQSNMRTIEGAVEQYLAASPNNTRSTCANTGWTTALVGASNYIKSEPKCPSNTGTYSYNSTSLQAVCPGTGAAQHAHF